jgi:hypothetical protein
MLIAIQCPPPTPTLALSANTQAAVAQLVSIFQTLQLPHYLALPGPSSLLAVNAALKKHIGDKL